MNERNATAAIALQEQAEALLYVHRLNVPSTLKETLTNTNIIENLIRNWRAATGNVKLGRKRKQWCPVGTRVGCYGPKRDLGKCGAIETMGR